MRQKIFVGLKIRQLREAGGLNQGAFAERLGISASYLNQIENNQRPLTAQVMVALAQTFSIDVGAFAQQDDDKIVSSLREAMADPVFGGLVPNGQDLKTIVSNVPWFAHCLSQPSSRLPPHWREAPRARRALRRRRRGTAAGGPDALRAGPRLPALPQQLLRGARRRPPRSLPSRPSAWSRRVRTPWLTTSSPNTRSASNSGRSNRTPASCASSIARRACFGCARGSIPPRRPS